MKTYPSIPKLLDKKINWDDVYHVFVKYDGSNIRLEWSDKLGWHKFGTRKTVITRDTEIFGSSIDLFLNKYAEDIEKVCQEQKWKSITCYAEWFGAETFAGQHKPDDPKDIVLFDVNVFKKGFLGPQEFVDLFGHLQVAERLFFCSLKDLNIQGIIDNNPVIKSKYPIKNNYCEGVICKTGSGHNISMFKIKTDDYKARLQETLGDDWLKYWE